MTPNPLIGGDTTDPQWVAEFCLGLGYARDLVVTTLVTRCSIDRSEAERIVTAVQQPGGPT